MIVTLIRPRAPQTDWLLVPDDGSAPEVVGLGLSEALTLETVMAGENVARVHARRSGDGWDILRRVADA